jgi:hypothetical protein
MRVPYLTGETIYLRALVAGDKETAAAWYPGPFPINAARAEDWLKEAHTDFWSANKPRHLIIARTEDDATVGSVASLAPWRDDADALRAAALRIVVPWARDDLELMVLTVPIAADETATLAAAEALGMERAARLRDYVARPGGRVDRFLYQALNAPWRIGDA